jgi:hypothetical protein
MSRGFIRKAGSAPEWEKEIDNLAKELFGLLETKKASNLHALNAGIAVVISAIKQMNPNQEAKQVAMARTAVAVIMAEFVGDVVFEPTEGMTKQ